VWRAARKQAGAPSVDYHDLRHTFASTLLGEGVSVKAVADWLGDASPVAILTTYSHLMPVERCALVPSSSRRSQDLCQICVTTPTRKGPDQGKRASITSSS
jgi:hypothetical protein